MCLFLPCGTQTVSHNDNRKIAQERDLSSLQKEQGVVAWSWVKRGQSPCVPVQGCTCRKVSRRRRGGSRRRDPGRVDSRAMPGAGRILADALARKTDRTLTRGSPRVTILLSH